MIAQARIHHLSQSFVLENGQVLRNPVIAYEEYGQSRGPVIFIAHGGLANQHAAGREGDETGSPGWWDGLIGPDKAFDTNRFRVIATNALGSMYGTTGPRSIDPGTQKSYGPTFPCVTLRDMVRFQKAFLNDQGIEHLACMAGPSMGSLQTLQMAALYPDFVDRIVAVATAGRTTPMALVAHHFMMNLLRSDHDFRDGWYDSRQPLQALASMFQFSKMFYGHEQSLRQMTWDKVADHPGAQHVRSEGIRNFLSDKSAERINSWDPNSIITVLNAINTHDLGSDQSSYAAGVRRITCPALLMNIDTDQEFSPDWAAEVGDLLNANNPGQAIVQVLASAWGHLGCLTEVRQMDSAIRQFLSRQGISDTRSAEKQIS